MDKEMGFVVFEAEDGSGGGAGGDATGGDAGAAANTAPTGGETAGGASVADGGAAGGETTGGASISGDAALPAELAQQFGVKTVGELAQFAGTMRNAAVKFRDHAQALQQRANATGNPEDQRKADAAKQTANAVAQKEFRLKAYGYDDEASFNKSYEADKLDGLATMMERIADARAKALFETQAKPIQDELQTHTQARYEADVQSISKTWQERYDAFTKADPRFAAKGADGKPGPLNGALSKLLTDENDYIRSRAQKDPNFNQYEWAANQVLGAVARSGQQHSESRLELANTIAGAARPGAGGGAIPKKQDEHESVRQTAQRVNSMQQAAGKPVLSEAELSELEQSLSKFQMFS